METLFRGVMGAVRFRDKLETEQKLVTVEISPPRGTDVTRLLRLAEGLKGRVDAINVPDCQRSILKMSALAAAKLIEDVAGVEAVWQLTCRDRNVIALQADLMGAYALGLRTVLALTGDPVQVGDQKDVAKQVFHLDSVRLAELIGHLNAGQDATGSPLKSSGTDFTIGAALNPFRLSNHAQQTRLRQKMERGVRFFQTQPVYDRQTLEEMNDIVAAAADNVGCARPKVLVGIIPPRSATAARMMNQTVIGINIPEHFIDLLERSADPVLESLHYCAEVVNTLKPVCDGFHLMPVGMESRVSVLLDQCFVPA